VQHHWQNFGVGEGRQAHGCFHTRQYLARYDDVREVMGGDPEVYSASAALELIAPLCPAAIDIAVRHGIVISPSVVDEDPPIHTAHRKSLHKPMARGRMQALEPLIRQLLNERLDGLVGRGEMDLVGDLLFEVPAYILFEMLGVPRSELGKVRRFAQRLAVLGFGQPNEVEQVAMMEGLAEFWEFCKANVARLMRGAASRRLLRPRPLARAAVRWVQPPRPVRQASSLRTPRSTSAISRPTM
jgi:cytochrome P450